MSRGSFLWIIKNKNALNSCARIFLWQWAVLYFDFFQSSNCDIYIHVWAKLCGSVVILRDNVKIVISYRKRKFVKITRTDRCSDRFLSVKFYLYVQFAISAAFIFAIQFATRVNRNHFDICIATTWSTSLPTRRSRTCTMNSWWYDKFLFYI
jgi:hypothetical protein